MAALALAVVKRAWTRHHRLGCNGTTGRTSRPTLPLRYRGAVRRASRSVSVRTRSRRSPAPMTTP